MKNFNCTHNKVNLRKLLIYYQKNIKKCHQLLKIPAQKKHANHLRESKLKVNFFSKFVDYPVISDDSGICIRSLKNKPGIYSSRLAKKHGSFKKAMIYILKKMKFKKDRSAVFICSLSFKYPKKKTINVTGKIKGKIAKKIIGKRGFGYDPIFIPNSFKKTFGQFPRLKKMKMDHRYLAFKN